MDLMLLRVFQGQVELQCQILLVSAQQLDEALKSNNMPSETAPYLWGAVQNLLGAAANLSKALWGQGGSLASERRKLRRSLQVTNASPLRPTKMRNHFEHFDERLDEWWATSPNHNHLDRCVMPPSAVQGLNEADMFRVLDPSTGELVFWGDKYDLPKIVAEVQRLLPIVAAEAAKPHWEP